MIRSVTHPAIRNWDLVDLELPVPWYQELGTMTVIPSLTGLGLAVTGLGLAVTGLGLAVAGHAVPECYLARLHLLRLLAVQKLKKLKRIEN